MLSYSVEFSKPKQEKPIPEGTVRVFFFIIDDEMRDDNHRVEF
jgi:hypothetical protein